MAEFLALRIVDHKLKYSEVPVSLKKEVKKILIQMGQDEYIK